MKKEILFIINPISGGKDKEQLPNLIAEHLDLEKFHPRVEYTTNVGHGKILAEKAIKKGVTHLVAVGGDGTINEVASAVVNTSCIMGIIPLGSGNGLARYLEIPLDIKEAIRLINANNYSLIDTASFNNKPFFNMAGIGFDAHISDLFSQEKNRGLIGYVRTTFQEIKKYKAQTYKLYIDSKKYKRKAFMISIANSSQYGNNAQIAPQAQINDGFLEVCVIKPFSYWKLPLLGLYLFSGKADKSPYLEIIKAKQIVIDRGFSGPVHVDGEPMKMQEHIEIQINPLSLKVISNEKNKKITF